MDDQVVITTSQTTLSGKDDGAEVESNPEYMAFVLVPVFFLLGLLGVVICHVLKRKGYRCTTAEDDPTPEAQEEGKDLEMGADLNDTVSDNNDTVGQIVHYIMKNEANSDALKAMVHDNSIDSDGAPSPPLTPTSPGAPPTAPKHTCNHLHTIGGAAGHKNMCTRCNQKKWPLMSKPAPRRAEVTVLSVGRFRVTKCDKPTKERRTLLSGDPNRNVASEDAVSNSRTISESQEEDKDN
ncbi:RELT-like protein 1 [Stigmatopora nigra]